MQKKIAKMLLTLCFTSVFSSSCLAAQYGLIDLGQSKTDLIKAAPSVIWSDMYAINPDYDWYIYPAKQTIFNLECTSSTYTFDKDGLGLITHNLSDPSKAAYDNAVKHLNKTFGLPGIVNNNAKNDCLNIDTDWKLKDALVRITHAKSPQLSFNSIMIIRK